jgi:hypothetical protein
MTGAHTAGGGGDSVPPTPHPITLDFVSVPARSAETKLLQTSGSGRSRSGYKPPEVKTDTDHTYPATVHIYYRQS